MMSDRILEELGELERERQAELADEVPARALSDAFKARLVASALAASASPASTSPPSTSPAPSLSKPRAIRSRPWMSRTVVGLAAIAAAVLVAVLAPRSPSSLPRYELTVTGGERAQRSGMATSDAKELRLAEGGAVLLELRPDEPVEAAIALQAYLYAENKLIAWDAATDVSPEGAARVELRVNSALASSMHNDAELVVVLARRDDPPATKTIEAQLRAGGERSGAWTLFRRKVALVEANAP